MGTPVDTNALKKLENEALSCERQNDFVSALDIYEEIDRKGWSSPRHLIALGECYMKARQRQNARDAWIRAFEADSTLNEVTQLLDRFFPGWTKIAENKQAGEDAPPPPPPPMFGGADAGLTVESVSYRKPPAPAEAVPPPEPPARKGGRPLMPASDATQLSSAPPPPDATQLSGSPLVPPARPAPARPAPPAKPVMPNRPAINQTVHMAPTQVIIQASSVNVNESGAREAKVNWSYIMADAAEEASKQRRPIGRSSTNA